MAVSALIDGMSEHELRRAMHRLVAQLGADAIEGALQTEPSTPEVGLMDVH